VILIHVEQPKSSNILTGGPVGEEKKGSGKLAIMQNSKMK
jgi:hypothetical protein